MDEKLLPQELSHPADMTSIRSFAICGGSGIGKTDLAIEYAYSRRHQFGAVFWLHAGILGPANSRIRTASSNAVAAQDVQWPPLAPRRPSMAPGSDTPGRLSPHQHELLHESGNNTNGQNTVEIIVFDRKSVQAQSIEKILDKNELLERDFYGMAEKRGSV
ncbi:hypothetical protein PENSUB_13554 [Penicillium subrubescens]|uniref:NB-ARC domain-containing protein n=1 Tax=Penicillium subrubescens TaxID=1316194 RepID=A0A1Q5SPR7_9EURO|nr:hypothetical protein PENSUB_13554 [Penicillium subrubescens]